MSSSNNQLDAIHRIVVRARLMAYRREDPTKIAALLDDAEYLISLANGGDKSEEFRCFLRDLGRRYPELAGVSVLFEESLARSAAA